VAQLPPAQELQPLLWLLVTSRLPPSPLLMAATADMTRRALASVHVGQAIGLSAWLMDRSASKRVWQFAQTYSYNGIGLPLAYGLDWPAVQASSSLETIWKLFYRNRNDESSAGYLVAGYGTVRYRWLWSASYHR